MSHKIFRADVRAARQSPDLLGVGILDICNGESDGEVVVTYQHAHMSTPISIQVLAQNLAEYPKGNSYIAFTQSPDVLQPVTDAIVNIQDQLSGRGVMSMVLCLARLLNNVFGPSHASPDDDETIGKDNHSGHDDRKDHEEFDNDSEASQDSGEYNYYYDFDGFLELSADWDKEICKNLISESAADHVSDHDSSAAGLSARIQYDLWKVRDAGYKVGIFDGFKGGPGQSIISISIRVNKLELSEQAVEAWGIHDTDYLVLLIRYENRYIPLETIIKCKTLLSSIQFRIGTCDKYRPSTASAEAAFGRQSRHVPDLTKTPEPSTSKNASNGCGHNFRKMFISNSLNGFMDESLCALLTLRETLGLSWDAANEKFLAQNARTSTSPVDNRDSGSAPSGQDVGMSAEAEEYSVLLNDHLCESVWPEASPRKRSFPLVAMQFAMRYFVRCNEFCLRCHRSVKSDVEVALKPYVCSDPLCLFQYMSMGLGPNVEHEILTQPSVVDLLVSLYYASISSAIASQSKGNQTRKQDNPVGLQLQVPGLFLPEPGSPLVKPIKVMPTGDESILLIQQETDFSRLHINQWIAFRLPLVGVSAHVLGPEVATYHAVVVDTDKSNQTITIKGIGRTGTCPTSEEGKLTEIYPYDMDFEALEDDSVKLDVMKHILQTMPSIREIHSHLVVNPYSTIRSFNKLSQPAAAVLQWIISSNRSCIQAIDCPMDLGEDQVPGATPETERRGNRERELILGLDGWIQFRFAQGSPDKELRFIHALRAVATRRDLDTHQTIFAWHGSRVGNWHSILRQGLRYDYIQNGRAWGDGIYFSHSFAMSQMYASPVLDSWPNSALRVTSVISLNEIINAPAEFVSMKPHYVVADIDWQQCRYLFVKSDMKVKDSRAIPVTSSLEFLEQAPGLEAIGPDSLPLRIPVAAMPAREISWPLVPDQTSNPKRVARKIAEESDDEDSEDLDFILRVDRESPPPAATKMPGMPLTDFRPGHLDLATLLRLEEPTWATPRAARSMSREVQKLRAVQDESPLAELGWWVDFDNMANMFQWIVELHSFDASLPLARDLKAAGLTSIVMELRFGKDFPFSPPFIRVVRPRMLPFMQGGGGHVTAGGAMCMELLTNSGWIPTLTMESVLMQVRLALCSLDPRPARLASPGRHDVDYTIGEAVDAYVRAARTHGWRVPQEMLDSIWTGPS